LTSQGSPPRRNGFLTSRAEHKPKQKDALTMSFEHYSKPIPDKKGPNWETKAGVLFCENFKSGSDQPLPDHFSAVDELVVPFLYEAIITLGNRPNSPWIINVVGQASSTGAAQANKELSRRRAINLADYAITGFIDYWSARQSTSPPKIVTNYLDLGDELSRKDPSARSNTSTAEQKQGAYRSVMFLFTAAARIPDSALPKGGKIRTVVGAEFKPNMKPLDEFFKLIVEKFGALGTGIELLARTQGISFDTAFPKFGLFRVLLKHPAVLIGKHMIAVSIPTSVTYAYQIYDGEHTRPSYIYRFDGTENSDSVGLLEFLGLYSSFTDALKFLQANKEKIDKLKDATGAALDSVGILAELTEIKEALHETIVRVARVIGGDFAQRQVAKLLDNYDAFKAGSVVASSDWSGFVYHRAAPIKNAGLLNGRAKRFKAGAFYIARETLEFAGPVPNNWVDFNATAEIKTIDIIGNSLLQSGWASGCLTLVGNRNVIE
jgi:hypothetical protein